MMISVSGLLISRWEVYKHLIVAADVMPTELLNMRLPRKTIHIEGFSRD
jgi:hypothetical protein